MWTFARHLLAVAILPFTVAVLIPRWILLGGSVSPRLADNAPEILAQCVGILLMAIGLTLFISSLRRFADEGKGTLAPWDPPRQLVVRGPYRYVRNPMISGVVFVLFGESLVFLSRGILEWAAIFVLMNMIYIPLIEEPMLVARFGEAYNDYRQNVPIIFPRRTPWTVAPRKD